MFGLVADALTIMATDVTTNAVLLSWQPLTGNGTGGSPITGYVITYYNDSGSPVTKLVNITKHLCNYFCNYLFHVVILNPMVGYFTTGQ